MDNRKKSTMSRIDFIINYAYIIGIILFFFITSQSRCSFLDNTIPRKNEQIARFFNNL